MALIQKEHQEQTEKLRNDYISYNPHEITEHYKSEIDRIDQELYGMTIEEQLSELNSFQQFLLKQRRAVSVFSVVSLYMILVLIFVRVTTCDEKSFFACNTKNDILILLPISALIMVPLLVQIAGRYKFGLLEKAREISSNLRIVFVLVFIAMTQIYFDIFGLKMTSVSSADETINLLRYAASVIFIISPFIFYYRHINNRANQLHILQLSLHRERNNLLFWIAEKSDDINSPKFQLAKEILNHTNKNGAADIGVRMLHPKFDKGRRWSLFGFGGNALSELEDKLEGLTDVIKQLELRAPKQDEDKQKTKGNDTDVGATTDNK